MDRRVSEFKREAARIEAKDRGRRYPASLRDLAVAVASDRIADGGSLSGAATELGVPAQTLTCWVSKSRHRAALVPVDVVAWKRVRSAKSDASQVRVTLPNGISIACDGVEAALVLVRGLL